MQCTTPQMSIAPLAPAERRRGRKPWTLEPAERKRPNRRLPEPTSRLIFSSSRQSQSPLGSADTHTCILEPSSGLAIHHILPPKRHAVHAVTIASAVSRPKRPNIILYQARDRRGQTKCLPDHSRLTFRQGNHVPAGWHAIRTPFPAEPSAARRHRQPARVRSIRLDADSTRAVAARVELAPHASTHTLQGIVRRLGA